MDAYMKTHIALVAPAAGAIYMAGGDIHRLAYMRESLMLLVRAIREGFKVLSTLDIPITPSAMNILNWIPERMLIFLLRMLFTTKMAVVGMERHANSAPDEMKELAGQFRVLIKQSGISTPSSDALYEFIDSQS
jgi:2-dehydropantoate 2-reductase